MNIRELLDYLAILAKRWWLILLLVVSTVGTILVISRNQTAVYEASLKFLFSTPPMVEVTVYNEIRPASVGDEIPAAKVNFMEIIRSTTVVGDAIEALGADITTDEVLAGLTVEQELNSEFVTLSLQCEDPGLAAALTNAVMNAALRYYGELRSRPTTMSRVFIASQLGLNREAWEKAEEELTKFQIEHKIGELDTELSLQQSLLRSLTLEHDAALAGGNVQVAEKYRAIIAERELELQNLLVLRPQYTALKAATRRTRGIYDMLLDRQTQAELKENEIENVGFISVLGTARKPSQPVQFNPKIALLGAAVSLVVGVLLAFGWEYLETQNVFETVADEVATDKHKSQKNLS